MNDRLSNATLSRAPVAKPGYDRATLRPRIVHLGLGAFFRAHGAVYTEDAGGDWGIVGVSLQRPDQRDRLAPQDGLYTTLERDGGGARARVIGSVLSVLVAPEDPGAVIAALAAASIVSLTVTE
jgi:fructuronate reductase